MKRLVLATMFVTVPGAVASAQTSSDFFIGTSANYFQTTDTTATDAFVIDLAAIGVAPGTTVSLEKLGGMRYGGSSFFPKGIGWPRGGGAVLLRPLFQRIMGKRGVLRHSFTLRRTGCPLVILRIGPSEAETTNIAPSICAWAVILAPIMKNMATRPATQSVLIIFIALFGWGDCVLGNLDEQIQPS